MQVSNKLSSDPAVRACDARAVGEEVLASLKALAQAKVGDHDEEASLLVGEGDEDVVGLDVAVDNFEAVQVVQASGGLLQDVERLQLLLDFHVGVVRGAVQALVSVADVADVVVERHLAQL